MLDVFKVKILTKQKYFEDPSKTTSQIVMFRHDPLMKLQGRAQARVAFHLYKSGIIHIKGSEHLRSLNIL
jgi:hypothetical protein